MNKNPTRKTRSSCRFHLVGDAATLKEEVYITIDAEDFIATIANLKEDAYVHCTQFEGTLKIFEDLGIFNLDDLRVLNLKDLAVFNFADLRVFVLDDLS